MQHVAGANVVASSQDLVAVARALDGRRGQDLFLFDETTRVPWQIWGRGARGAIPGGRRVRGLARGVDLAPTLADLAGVPWSWPRQLNRDDETLGRSLAPCVRGQTSLEPVDAMTFTTRNAFERGCYPSVGPELWHLGGIRSDERWYLWDGIRGEGRVHHPNGRAAATTPSAAARFQALELERLRAVTSTVTAGADEPFDGDLVQRLEALGYLD